MKTNEREVHLAEQLVQEPRFELFTGHRNERPEMHMPRRCHHRIELAHLGIHRPDRSLVADIDGHIAALTPRLDDLMARAELVAHRLPDGARGAGYQNPLGYASPLLTL